MADQARVQEQIPTPAPTSRRDETTTARLGRAPIQRKGGSLSVQLATLAPTTGAFSVGGPVDVQRKPATASEVAASGIGSGSAIPHKSAMEASFGQDFSGVRAHTGPAAAAACEGLGAAAYATGSDVVFGSSSPAPSVVAHELTHVLQQRGDAGSVQPMGGGLTTTGESQAERVEAAVAAGKPASSVLDQEGLAEGEGIQRLSLSSIQLNFPKPGEGKGSARFRFPIMKFPPMPLGLIPLCPPAPIALSAYFQPGVEASINYALDEDKDTTSIGAGVYGIARLFGTIGIPMLADAYLSLDASVSGTGQVILKDGAINGIDLLTIALKGGGSIGVLLGGGMIDLRMPLVSVNIATLKCPRYDADGRHDNFEFEWFPSLAEDFAWWIEQVEAAGRVVDEYVGEPLRVELKKGLDVAALITEKIAAAGEAVGELASGVMGKLGELMEVGAAYSAGYYEALSWAAEPQFLHADEETRRAHQTMVGPVIDAISADCEAVNAGSMTVMAFVQKADRTLGAWGAPTYPVEFNFGHTVEGWSGDPAEMTLRQYFTKCREHGLVVWTGLDPDARGRQAAAELRKQRGAE